MPRGAAARDRPSAEEVLRAAVYWFSWLLILGLLAITVPLCWFGKELVAGRQTIRAKVKAFCDWYEGAEG